MSRITYDLEPDRGEPVPGDLIEVTATGTRYLISGVREVRQREVRPTRRWALEVVRLGDPAIYRTLGPDPRIWSMRWYRRGETP